MTDLDIILVGLGLFSLEDVDEGQLPWEGGGARSLVEAWPCWFRTEALRERREEICPR